MTTELIRPDRSTRPSPATPVPDCIGKDFSNRTVVVVHTGPATVQPIKQQQFQQILPEVRVINIMDDSLLNDVIAAGHLTESVTRRIFLYMQVGQQMGADVLLNACSSVGEAASAARLAVSIPLIKIDDVMAERAVASGPRIGVVATVRTTLDPTVRLIKSKAAAVGRSIEVREALAEGGFQALLDGKSRKKYRVFHGVRLFGSSIKDAQVEGSISVW